MILRGAREGIAEVRELAGAPEWRPAAVEEQPAITDLDRAVDVLVEMKNLSEAAVGLAYSALLLRDAGLAAQVSQLEDRLDEMREQLELWVLRAAAETVDPSGLRGLLHLGAASEEVGDAAQQLVWLVEAEEEMHPVLDVALGEADDVVVQYPIAAGSALDGAVVGGTQLGDDTAPSSGLPAATGYCTTTSSVSPSAAASTGCISSSSSTSHTSCWAASPTSSDAAPRCNSPRKPDGSTVSAAGAQHPQLELLAHLVEPVLELAHLRRQAGVPQQECRVREADRGLGDVLHVDEHVDGAVEIGDRRVFLDRGGSPLGRARQLADLGDPLAGAAQDQHVVGEQQVFAIRVEEPVAAAPERDDPHPDLHRQLDLFELAVGERGAGAHAHPVRHLLGGGEVGDQRGRDAEPVGDDARHVDRGVSHALDRRDHVEHARHLLGVVLRARREHADLAHLVDEVGEPLLELAHLVGHAGVGEEQRRVAEVDHQLGGVLGLREHGFQISRGCVAGSFVHQLFARAGISRDP